MNGTQNVKYIEIDPHFAGFIVHGPTLTCVSKPDFVGEMVETASWAKHIRVENASPQGVKVKFEPRSSFTHAPSERQEHLFRECMDRALKFFGTDLARVSQDRKIKHTPNMYL